MNAKQLIKNIIIPQLLKALAIAGGWGIFGMVVFGDIFKDSVRYRVLVLSFAAIAGCFMYLYWVRESKKKPVENHVTVIYNTERVEAKGSRVR